jgi:hypothetical protein
MHPDDPRRFPNHPEHVNEDYGTPRPNPAQPDPNAQGSGAGPRGDEGPHYPGYEPHPIPKPLEP